MLPTIVVVEAHPDIRSLLQRALTMAGFDVITAADDTTARMSLAASSAELLIIDGDLPHTEVQELIDHAQAAAPAMPVLVLVSEPESVERDGAVVLAKPFSLTTLTQQVQRLLMGAPGPGD